MMITVKMRGHEHQPVPIKVYAYVKGARLIKGKLKSVEFFGRATYKLVFGNGEEICAIDSPGWGVKTSNWINKP